MRTFSIGSFYGFIYPQNQELKYLQKITSIIFAPNLMSCCLVLQLDPEILKNIVASN